MSRSVRHLSLVVIVTAVAVGPPLLGQNADTARGVVERAAGALGGLERIRAVKNITLKVQPITQDNLQKIIDAKWLTKDVLCKNAATGPTPWSGCK